jgi:hypothetical protein
MQTLFSKSKSLVKEPILSAHDGISPSSPEAPIKSLLIQKACQRPYAKECILTGGFIPNPTREDTPLNSQSTSYSKLSFFVGDRRQDGSFWSVAEDVAKALAELRVM